MHLDGIVEATLSKILKKNYDLLLYIHFVVHVQVVLLDERGQDISSEEMADLLGDAGNMVQNIFHFLNIYIFI